MTIQQKPQRYADYNTNLFIKTTKRIFLNKLVLFFIAIIIITQCQPLVAINFIASCNLSLGDSIAFNALIELN